MGQVQVFWGRKYKIFITQNNFALNQLKAKPSKKLNKRPATD
jgi:hypothetical protein